MSRKNILTIAIPLVILMAIAIPVLYYFSLAPVLIVVDHSFTLLYDEARIRKESKNSSFALFRPVKTVTIADDVSADIIQFAISEISSAPFCVIFSLRFAQAARMYREQNPEIPVVILEGRYPENANPASFAIGNSNNDYFIYITDITNDFYLAGKAASILDEGKNGRVAVLLEPNTPVQAREAFMRAINDMKKPLQVFFYTTYTSFYDAFSRDPDWSCIVLAGIGSEHLEDQSNIPIIVFSWINLLFLPDNVVMIFNDSPLAQTVKAVEMVATGMTKGEIMSKREIISGNNSNKDTLQQLRNIGINK